ncbi:MAG: crotonase/enoyl-CoA hydratase family protein [Beijerinckiaceae bacterium]|jgi:DSF synthase|nr:crotonase/enoyl-CoA hydratase family protein [Beijerinckiaceae bacterium]
MNALVDQTAMVEASIAAPVDTSLVQSAYLDFIATRYGQMDVAIESKLKTAWVRFNSATSPSFSRALLHDLLKFEKVLAGLLENSSRADQPVKFVVSASRMPGIYNLGGDLALFADCIRRQDRQALSTYARECCEMVYHGYTAFKLPVVLVGLIQGDALGGGFECALSCGVLVAERKARFGMPEILFNMFPGMGAYSLLSRRIGQIEAERMILSGKIFTAAEMFDMGLVDVLAEDGEGEQAVQDYIARNLKRHGTIQALHDVRRRVGGLNLQELLDVTERWVDEAMHMDEGSLKRMERLRSAQAKRVAENKAA